MNELTLPAIGRLEARVLRLENQVAALVELFRETYESEEERTEALKAFLASEGGVPSSEVQE